MQNTAMSSYAAWLERIYISDTNGRIAYKGDMDPFGCNPDKIEEYLEDWFRLTS